MNVCRPAGVYPEHAVLYYGVSGVSLVDVMQRFLDRKTEVRMKVFGIYLAIEVVEFHYVWSSAIEANCCVQPWIDKVLDVSAIPLRWTSAGSQ